MASPSAAAVAWIKAQKPDFTQTDAAIAAALNAETAANPLPHPTVPSILDEAPIMALLTDPANNSIGKLMSWVNLPLLFADIAAQARARVVVWVKTLPLSGLITASESTAILSYLNTPVPDPSYQATVSAPVAAIGRPLDAEDIEAARTAP